MTDKDIHSIIYSYLTLQELHKQDVDDNTLLKIFKERDLVVIELSFRMDGDEDQSDEMCVSYKLTTRADIIKFNNKLDDMFKPYKTKKTIRERNVSIGDLNIVRSDFGININNDYDKMIKFFRQFIEEYSEYLRLFDMIDNCNIFSFNKTELKIPTYFYLPEMKTVYSNTDGKIYNKLEFYDDVTGDETILVTCYWNHTGQSSMIIISQYNSIVNYINKNNPKLILKIDNNKENINRFNIINDGEYKIGNGCLDILLHISKK